MLKNRRILSIILVFCSLLYFIFLLRIIIFKNGLTYHDFNYNLHLFDFINQWQSDGMNITLLVNILGNIALFIPLSIILLNYYKCLNNVNVVFIGFLMSFSFELIQFSTSLGIFDVDDILLNTIGSFIGLIIYRFFKQDAKLSSTIFLVNFGLLGYISLTIYMPSLLSLSYS